MATVGITKRSVDALQKSDRDAYLWDDELRGFGVKITPAGAKSYIFAYRVGGREAVKKRYTIGRHGSPWTPATARQRAEALALLVAQGIDPLIAEREQRKAETDRRRETVSLAFGAYAERFIDEYLKAEWPDSWPMYAAILRNKAKPSFSGKAIPEITRSNISAFISGLGNRPALRRNAFTALRRLFRWAINEGVMADSPMRDMDAPTGPAARDRFLADDDLAEIWKAAAGLGYPFGPMFRLLIATGQRRSEVAALDWRELDRDSAIWTLPAARAKNDSAHIVPLNVLSIAELDAMAGPFEEDEKPHWPRRGLVFTTTGKTAVSGYSRAKMRLDAAVHAARAEEAKAGGSEPHEVDAWRMHDLRRTLATGMQRLGVRFEVTEAILNHVSGSRAGVAGIYQRHDWADEKRAALDAWSRHLSAIITPSDRTNIHTLSSGRRSAA